MGPAKKKPITGNHLQNILTLRLTNSSGLLYTPKAQLSDKWTDQRILGNIRLTFTF